jgi:hypothetical protein
MRVAEHYARGADQERLADEAMHTIEARDIKT